MAVDPDQRLGIELDGVGDLREVHPPSQRLVLVYGDMVMRVSAVDVKGREHQEPVHLVLAAQVEQLAAAHHVQIEALARLLPQIRDPAEVQHPSRMMPAEDVLDPRLAVVRLVQGDRVGQRVSHRSIVHANEVVASTGELGSH